MADYQGDEYPDFVDMCAVFVVSFTYVSRLFFTDYGRDALLGDLQHLTVLREAHSASRPAGFG